MQLTDALVLRAWLLAPFKIAGAFVIGGFGGALAAGALDLWETPVAGFVAAALVVLCTYCVTPAHKILFSALSLALGGVLAWWLLKNTTWPENHPTLAYQLTLLPLWCTYIGGSVGMLGAICLGIRSERPCP